MPDLGEFPTELQKKIIGQIWHDFRSSAMCYNTKQFLFQFQSRLPNKYAKSGPKVNKRSIFAASYSIEIKMCVANRTRFFFPNTSNGKCHQYLWNSFRKYFGIQQYLCTVSNIHSHIELNEQCEKDRKIKFRCECLTGGLRVDYLFSIIYWNSADEWYAAMKWGKIKANEN